MILKKIIIKNFGPFENYEIDFSTINLNDQATILLTGKNNQGKTTIINALKLLHYGFRAINNNKLRFIYNDEVYFKLHENDIEDINIGRMIHNYIYNEAQIIAEFSNRSRLVVVLNNNIKKIYATYEGRIYKTSCEIFGFIPPLGQIAEQEEILTQKHILQSINTTLAPRHLRNHFYQILTINDFNVIRMIINQSWEDIELLNYEIDSERAKIYCFYKEKGFDREIAWAGQGLQIWFQIITHLIRLKNSSILILDEPEIFLHTEKQIQLLQIIKEHFKGDLIIATHSVELMNSVEISHIIHVRNDESAPQIKLSSDKESLEKIRIAIGSSFNFVASSFEKVDIVIFTEDEFDFSIIKKLSTRFYPSKKIHNVRIHGFMGYPKCALYKEAYEELIGKTTDFVLVVDRDYYPYEQLEEIKNKLSKNNIKVVFTPGKEIENLFIKLKLLKEFLSSNDELNKLEKFLDKIFEDKYDDFYGSYIKLHKGYYKKDEKEIIAKYSKAFRLKYKNKTLKYNLVGGKDILKVIRDYFALNFKRTITNRDLIDKLIEISDNEVAYFIGNICN